MSPSEAAVALEAEWHLPEGFFALLHEKREFDAAGASRVLAILGDVDLGDGEVLDRGFVRQVWFIPLFSHWKEWRVEQVGGDSEGLKAFINRAQTLVMELLGLP